MDNQTTQNSSGMMNGMPPAPQSEKKVGPIFAIIIIVILLIIGAFYLFGQKVRTAPVVEQSIQTEQPTMTASVIQADDTGSLEAELSAEMKNVDYSF